VKRAARIAAVALLVTFAAAGSALWFLLDTAQGAQIVVGWVEKNLGLQLRIGAFDGTLLDEFSIENLHFVAGDGTVVDIGHAHLRLAAHDLLEGRLRIRLAQCDRVRVLLTAPSARGSSGGEPKMPTALPLGLILDDFELRDFVLRQAPDDTLLTLASADLEARWLGRTLDIRRLRTAFAETGPLQLSAVMRVFHDHFELQSLLLNGPGSARATGTVSIGSAPSRLNLQWQGLHWPLLADASDRLVDTTDGQGQVEGSLDAYRLDLQATAALYAVPLGQIHLRGSGNTDRLHVESLDTQPAKGSVHAQGDVVWSPALRVDARAQFERLDPAQLATDWPGSLNGAAEAHVSESGGNVLTAFNIRLDHSTLRGRALTLAAEGNTDDNGVTLNRFLLQSGKGTIDAAGSIAWSPPLRANLKARIAGLDPGAFVQDWNGDLSGAIELDTTARDKRAAVAFSAQLDHSRLRGFPLRLAARGEWLAAGTNPFSLHGGALTFSVLDLTSGTSHLTASGRVTEPFDVSGAFNSGNLGADLAPLTAGLGGHAAFDFHAQGTLADPHVASRGSGGELRWQEYKAGSLIWNLDLDPQKPSHLTLDLDRAELVPGIAGGHLEASGDEHYHTISLHAQGSRGSIDVGVDGGYDRLREEWGGQLASLKLAPQNLAPWSLEAPAGLLLGVNRQSLEQACIGGSMGRFCAQLEQNVLRAGLRLSWQLQQLRLVGVQPLLPPAYKLGGTVDGNGSFEFSGGDVAAAAADIQMRDVVIQAGDVPPFALQPSTAKIEDQGGRLHALVNLNSAQANIQADVAAAPAASFRQRALSGSVQVQMPDLGFVRSLSSEVTEIGGHIGGSLQLDGTIGLPRIGGRLALDEGHAKLATPEIDLQQVRMTVSGNGDGPLTVEGSAHSGDGDLAVNGSFDPAVAPPRADLAVHGANFLALATAEAHIWIDPDLHIVGDDQGIHLNGTLTVPKARIAPRGLSDQGVSVSSDQVIVGAEAPPESAPLALFADIALVLGDDVHIEGMGLTSRLTGQVRVTEQPAADTLGRGELQLVDGQYKAYGQDLKIETGKLIFTGGPVTKPGIDIYATRRPQQDITVGVRVRGTLDQPQLSLESDPAMPRDQQLSWLVLGQSLDQSSSSDRSMVSQAALSLGLSGSGYFVDKIGKKIGLDQISVGQAPVTGGDVAANAASIQGSQASLSRGTTNTYTTQAAQLTLGKYLTPRLFVSYGVSLFQPGQTFRLLYDLGHHFKVQTESGTANGGDLLYTYDAGH
jgi:translocation and assembly module TamB